MNEKLLLIKFCKTLKSLVFFEFNFKKILVIVDG